MFSTCAVGCAALEVSVDGVEAGAFQFIPSAVPSPASQLMDECTQISAEGDYVRDASSDSTVPWMEVVSALVSGGGALSSSSCQVGDMRATGTMLADVALVRMNITTSVVR